MGKKKKRDREREREREKKKYNSTRAKQNKTSLLINEEMFGKVR